MYNQDNLPICSDIGPFTEFLSPYPVLRSLQFQVGTVDELKEKLLEANRSPIDMTGISEDIGNRFSAQRMASGYMELYKELIKRHEK